MTRHFETLAGSHLRAQMVTFYISWERQALQQQSYWENLLPSDQQMPFPAATPISVEGPTSITPLAKCQLVFMEGKGLSSSNRSPKPTGTELETL